MDELIGLFGVSEEDGNEHSYEAQLLTDSAQHQLQPEVEEGNVEFKLKLVDPSPARLEHLVTQLKWRLREGSGEAIYQIGVGDRGAVLGLCPAELHASLDNLNKMAQRLNAETSVLREVTVDWETERKAVEVLVRKVPSDKCFIDMRVSLLGSQDAGKSTLVGVLTNRELDNGHGRARLNLFRHLHEMQTGHTSSVCHDICGFDEHGNVIDYSVVRSKEEICERSTKLVTLIDLPGGMRSLKTTVFGLTGYCPDLALIAISAPQGIVETTKEHFGLALALSLPCAILLTKTDQVSGAVLDRLRSQVASLLQIPGVARFAHFVNTTHDAVLAAEYVNGDRVTPVFLTSCVTGAGTDLLRTFLNLAQPRSWAQDAPLPAEVGEAEKGTAGAIGGQDSDNSRREARAEFKVDETYDVPNVGCVVRGILHRGLIRRQDSMHLGPYEDGSFRAVKITSLHRTGRAPSSIVNPSEAAAIAFKPNYPVRKGMVLLGVEDPENAAAGADAICGNVWDYPKACTEFETELLLLYHPTRISTGFQCTLHIDNIVQTAVITGIVSAERRNNCEDERESVPSAPAKLSCSPGKGMASSCSPAGGSLENNQKARVSFRFTRYCEYLRPGMRVLMRQGKSKGIGHVTNILLYASTATPPQDSHTHSDYPTQATSDIEHKLPDQTQANQ